MKLIIKYFLTVAIALGLGLAAGWAYQKYEATKTEENFFSDQWNDSMGSADRPIVTVVGGERIDMGTISRDKNSTQEFIFKNDGTTVLEVWKEPGGLPEFLGIDLSRVKEDIAVGETRVVTVTVSSKVLKEMELEDGRFSAEVVIRSTDPSTPKVSLQLSGTLSDKSEEPPKEAP